MSSGTHKHIAVLSTFLNDLNKSHRMSKWVKIYSSCRANTKFFLEIALSFSNLSNKAFTTWHIAVRLQVPSAHYMPLSCLYKLLNFGKKLRCVFFHILIYCHLIVTENIIKLITKLSSRVKCR